MKQDEFKLNYAKMCVAYRQETGKATMKVYWSMFKDLPDTVFTQVVNMAIKSSEFFPTVAKLHDIIDDIDNRVPTEEDVMNDMRHALGKYGVYKSPKFKYPITHAIAEAIGWLTLCNTTDDRFNDTVHFRYVSTASHYKKCLRSGEPFPVNRLKGLFEIQGGEKVTLQSGQEVYMPRDKKQKTFKEILDENIPEGE